MTSIDGVQPAQQKEMAGDMQVQLDAVQAVYCLPGETEVKQLTGGNWLLTVQPHSTLDSPTNEPPAVAIRCRLYISSSGDVFEQELDCPADPSASAALASWQQQRTHHDGHIDRPDISYIVLIDELLQLGGKVIAGMVAAPCQHQTEADVATQQYVRRIYIFHHLYSARKQRALVELSRSHSINGIHKNGRPGVVVAEGQRDDVDAFERGMKALRWQSCQRRYETSTGQPLLQEYTVMRPCPGSEWCTMSELMNTVRPTRPIEDELKVALSIP